mgnify:CR=1 FL=1
MRKGTFARLETRQQGRRLFLLSWPAYAAAYVGRYNYSAVMAAITAEGVLSLPAAGAVSTGYFVCYAVGQVLCGLLSQRVSPFGMIPAGLLFSAGCNMGMGMAPAGAMPILWAANGLFQAMVWPPIVRLFAECMPLVQQDQACVSINSTTPAGTLAAYALSAAAMALAGWRMAFWGCGAVMLAAAVLWMLGTPSLRRAVQSGPAAAPVPAAEKEPSGVRLLPVLAGAGLMGLILPAMLHGGLKDGVTSWVPSMIQSNFGVGPAFAAAVSMALPLVNLTGAYGAGWLDRCVFRNEVKTSAALFAGALVCLLALPAAVNYSLPLPVALLAATTALMLGINTMFINVMPVRAGRRAGAAFLSGSLNAITYLGAAIATWGIGAAAQGFGWGAVLALWAVMAGTALAVCLLLARRWGRFALACETERGERV